MLAASLSVSVLAQEKFEQGKPGDSNYRYLDEYKALKRVHQHFEVSQLQTRCWYYCSRLSQQGRDQKLAQQELHRDRSRQRHENG